MERMTCAITDPAGLHARPASKLVQFASGLQSKVTLIAGEKSVDAKSVLAVMTLGVPCGEQIVFELEGDTASTDMAQLAEFCGENL